jgi:hypothetical protein
MVTVVRRPASSSGPLGRLWDGIKGNERLHLAWCAVGVVGCLMLYGVLQASERGGNSKQLRGTGTACTLAAAAFTIACTPLICHAF